MIGLLLNSGDPTDFLQHIGNLVFAACSVCEPHCAFPGVQVKLLRDSLRPLKQSRTVVVGHGEVQLKHGARVVSKLVLVERYDAGFRKILLQ